MDRTPLTDDECQAITEVCMCDPHGWAPHPENLPLAEHLRERGILTRRLREGRAVYTATGEFKAAAALNAAMGSGSVN